MTQKELQTLVRGIAPVIRQELDALEKRIAQLEAQPRGLSYAGTWQRERAYGQGFGVTHHGSMWVATRATTSEPGAENSGWQLAVKKGRDARDAR